jgi:hypothetical protein
MLHLCRVVTHSALWKALSVFTTESAHKAGCGKMFGKHITCFICAAS